MLCQKKLVHRFESISWMTADGFAAAVNSFIAQNHGAGNRGSVSRKGYSHAMGIVLVWGIFCTLLLILCPKPIFQDALSQNRMSVPMGCGLFDDPCRRCHNSLMSGSDRCRRLQFPATAVQYRRLSSVLYLPPRGFLWRCC